MCETKKEAQKEKEKEKLEIVINKFEWMQIAQMASVPGAAILISLI